MDQAIRDVAHRALNEFRVPNAFLHAPQSIAGGLGFPSTLFRVKLQLLTTFLRSLCSTDARIRKAVNSHLRLAWHEFLGTNEPYPADQIRNGGEIDPPCQPCPRIPQLRNTRNNVPFLGWHDHRHLLQGRTDQKLLALTWARYAEDLGWLI